MFRSLLAIPRFRRILGAYLAIATASFLAEIALALAVLRETGSPAAVAAIFLVGQFAPAVAGPAVVAAAERAGLRAPIRTAIALDAILLLAVAAALQAPFALALALVALEGTAASVARSYLKATAATTTEPLGLLREGNAVLITAFSISCALGPIAAGVTVALLSPTGALAAGAVFLTLAALIAPRSSEPVTDDDGRAEITARRSFRSVFADPQLRPLAAGAGILAVLGAAVVPVEVVLVRDTLGGSEADFGLVLGAWGVGSVLGSTLLPRIKDVPLRPLAAACFAVYAASYLGMGLSPTIAGVITFSLLGGSCNGIDFYAINTAVQERTPADRQAQTASVFDSLSSGGIALGYLLGGLVATTCSTRLVYVLAAAGLGMMALVLARDARPAPQASTV